MNRILLLSLVLSIPSVEAAIQESGGGADGISQGALEPRVSIAHKRFEPGTAHVWALVLEAGDFAEVHVVQRGVDVVVAVLDPSGEIQVESDLPLGSGEHGTERAVWVAEQGGDWKIEVRPYDDAPAGEYGIELRTVRAASERERGLVEAQATTIAAVSQHEKRLYEQAEASYRRALAMLEAVVGAGDVTLATNLNLLASFFGKSLRRYDDAKKLHLRALAIQEQSLDPDHPDIAVTARSLAALHRSEGHEEEQDGEYEEAEALYQRAYELDSSYLGADDRTWPSTTPISRDCTGRKAGSQRPSPCTSGRARSMSNRDTRGTWARF